MTVPIPPKGIQVHDKDGEGITSTASAPKNALDVNIAASDVALGGGTQYANDTAVATPTGTVALGHDGSNVRAIETDAVGRVVVVGAATDGAAVSGNPVRIAGKDGSNNTQDISTDSSGRVNVNVIGQVDVGKFSEGDSLAGKTGFAVGGEDGSGNYQHFHVDDPTGDQYVIVSSGSLDVVGVIPGTGASQLGKPEDGAHTSGDVGVEALAVRNDANATRTSADGDYSPISVDLAGNPRSVGNIDHDSVDAGSPIKIGGKTVDYLPDTEGEQGATAVAASDRANAAFNLLGELVPAVKAEYQALGEINNVFDTAAESVTSSNYVCWQYREASIAMDLSKSGTPTDILLTVECSNDGTNYEPYDNNGMADMRESNASIGTGGKKFHRTFKICCQKIRFKLTSSGTDGSNTITSANATCYFRT